MDYFRWLFVSWEGRINRQLYLLSLLAICILPYVPVILSMLFGFELWADWLNFYFLCMIGPFISLMIKRLHDTDRNFLWLLKIIPVFGLLVVGLGQWSVVPEKPRKFIQESGPAQNEKYVMFSLFVALIFVSALMASLVSDNITSDVAFKASFGALFFIFNLWMLVVLWALPGTVGDNRYGSDPVVKDEEHPCMEKIETAIGMIEPWVDRHFPFALSLQAQLEWCQLVFSGLGSGEKPKGELSLVNIAESAFDEWNEKQHLIVLLKDIEHAAQEYL